MATSPYPHATNLKKYTQSSISSRLEACFLDNVGKILTREQLIEVATDPITGEAPENWHQRLSELRTDAGYTILSKRDRRYLKVGEYLMVDTSKRENAGKRVLPTTGTWTEVLTRAKNSCEWTDGGQICGLLEGDIDPIGGGTVKLTPDHKSPHSINPATDRTDSNQWQALCGRHQVVKKNFWDSNTGKVNTIAVLQALPAKEKKIALEFLLAYFGLEVK
jgi:hypothetical protein